ncbi:MAG: HAMP domain-containing histidine kinase, partial [Actinomycetota bacterium]|nr:HAMP domain-containing histidine kinase [Actinomycetota bacterium]
LSISRKELPEELPDPWSEFSLPEAVVYCFRKQKRVEARVSGEKTYLQLTLEHLPRFDDHKGGVLVVMQDLSEGLRLEANQQRFLANAAHELKTPIGAIIGASELLLTGDDEEPELRRRFLNHIHSEACRMQQLSETLLQMARTGWDLREPNLEVLCLDTAARKAAERVEPLVESAGLKLCVEGQGTHVRADAEWLEQALLVVLSNAIKNSGWGRRIRLRVSDAAVAVEDEGAGISEEELPYVFDLFYQGKESSGGFGLGLPICKDLVERMGGEISIDSQEGVGTTVEIELPEAETDA